MKLHLVLNSNKKFVAFSLSPSQNHDVSRAKKLLQQFKGQVVGDSGYIYDALKKWLEKRGLKMIANIEKAWSRIAALKKIAPKTRHYRNDDW